MPKIGIHFLTILVVVTVIIFGSLSLTIDHTTTITPQQQLSFIGDLSFDIYNVTFSLQTAFVNGIQLHYVIDGQGTKKFCCIVGHKHSMNDIISCQLGKNYCHST